MAEEKAVGEAKFDIDLLQEWAQALIEVMASGTLLEHIPVRGPCARSSRGF
jgi:hypothetical protein